MSDGTSDFAAAFAGSVLRTADGSRSKMTKHLFCAAAALIGSIVGANAPEEWRGDQWRYVGIAAAVETAQPASLAMIYRPYQRGD